MKILAIETSCDECSAAVVEAIDGPCPSIRVIAHKVFSQIELHSPYGGVVPEIASRNHLDMIHPILQETLSASQLNWSDLTHIAVTNRPGLIGALLVGVSAAKTLAYVLKKPLIPVDHLSGHLHSLFLSGQKKMAAISAEHFPMLVCLVSGGHTQLLLLSAHPAEKNSTITVLSSCRDDAAGEAFDKSAKLLGLPYPGGKYIDLYSRQGDEKRFPFTVPMGTKTLDFSFSGIKTAMANHIEKLGYKTHIFGPINETTTPREKDLFDLCASVQKVIIETLMSRIHFALNDQIRSVAIVGGVSANTLFRNRLEKEISLPIFMPDAQYCTDNAAMIGAAAYFEVLRNHQLNSAELFHLNAFSQSKTFV